MAGDLEHEDASDRDVPERMQQTMHRTSFSSTAIEADPKNDVEASTCTEGFTLKDYRRRFIISICILFAAFVFLSLMTRCTQLLLRPGRMRDEYFICHTRVTKSQLWLLIGPLYWQQLGDTKNMRELREDPQRCSSGFRGNGAAYGLGVRLCIYMFWASSMIADHVALRSRFVLARVYNAVLIAACLATFVLTLTNSCTFAIEIVILYYLFWGSICSIYLSPRIESDIISRTSIRLGWDRLMRLALMTLMIMHAAWFWTIGYDVQLARLPCGTYHFFFGKVQDHASPGNAWRSTYLMRVVLLSGLTLATVVGFALSFVVLLLFAGEIASTVQGCSLYRSLFVRPMARATDNPLAKYTDGDMTSMSTTKTLRSRYRRAGHDIRIWQTDLHDRYALSFLRAFDRFVTPKHITEKHRR